MKTKVLVEHFLGDLMKVVACQLDDLFEKDNLQIAEIKSLVKSRISKLPMRKTSLKKRPKASTKFMKGYHSGNFYTLTKSKSEDHTKHRLDVLSTCFYQAVIYDGLNKREFLALCDSYVDEHFDDGVNVDGEDTPN
jgi:hypothetical protein